MSPAPHDPAVQIVPFQDRHAAAFRDLNLVWIEALFEVEEPDRRQLDDPRGEIIDQGGDVLIAELDGEPVGACALLAHGTKSFELAKMVVDPTVRSRGIGALLLEAAMERARSAGAEEMTLLSHSCLDSALRLYERYGFERVPLEGQSCDYIRCDVAMRRDL